MSTTTPTLAQLQRGLAISEQIASLEAELASLFTGSAPAPEKAAVSTATKADGRSGKRSPETIAKMKASQQARWAKVNGTNGKAPIPKSSASAPKSPAKKKFTMSPEAKAKIGAAMKARWAAKNAG